LKTLKHILARYTAFLWSLLLPLGIWGVLVIAVIDSAFLGLPLDAIVAGYVYHDRSHFLLYVLLASAGSAIGSIFLYVVGHFGGEALLRKRLSPARFQTIHRSFDQHEFWALMFPAMLPPPTPFKLFVLAAAGFEMNFGHFLLAIFSGRFIRFFILSLLTIKYGEGVVEVVGSLFKTHLHLTLGIIGGVVLVVWFLRQRRRKRRMAENE
jgi:membrane protein YqaA with SNARE-associated domain